MPDTKPSPDVAVAIALLRRVRALITNYSTWTTGCAARDAFGNEVEAESSEARSFCMCGATARAKYERFGLQRPKGFEIALSALRKVSQELYGSSVLIDINDGAALPGKLHHELHSIVIDLIERAIYALQQG